MQVCTLNGWVIASEILFSAICIVCSVVCWVIFLNVQKLKLLVHSLEKQVLEAQLQLSNLEKQTKIEKIDLKKVISNPMFILKLIEVISLFKTNKLSKLNLLKTFISKK